MVNKFPNFNHEISLWEKYELVGGVDEVGRGAFAGPVVSACVLFDPAIARKKIEVAIDDSKKLHPEIREEASYWIKENALTWGIGSASAAMINRLGIVKATHTSMRRAIKDANRKLTKGIEYLLLDAFYLPFLKGIPSKSKNSDKGTNLRQLAIIKGDGISKSIAAASIIAKVYRDAIMVDMSKHYIFNCYGWEKNKGYGTKSHLNALHKFGITKQHRKKFVKTHMAKI
jgi:ribonuclease HII